jgi:hypothetical protein
MKIQTIIKVAAIMIAVAFGGASPLRAATIDFGLQLLSDNVLTSSSGVDLGSGAVFIGNWKDSVSDYSAALASAVASAAAMPDPTAALTSALSTYFTIGIADSWSGITSSGSDSQYLRMISSDTGLAARFIDAVFFTAGATEFGSIRWNSAYPDTEALGRSADIALVVPSFDPDSAPSTLVGTIFDNGDGTGQFQTVPEPTSGILVAGAGFLFCLARSFQRKS